MKQFKETVILILVGYFCVALIAFGFVGVYAMVDPGGGPGFALGLMGILMIGLGIFLLIKYFRSERYRNYRAEEKRRAQEARAKAKARKARQAPAPAKPYTTPTPAGPTAAVCPDCGKRYPLDKVYCEECGALLEKK